MATIQWGAWAGAHPKKMRIGIEYYSVPVPALYHASVTVTIRIWLEAYYWFYDSSNSLSWAGTVGSGSSSENIDIGTGQRQVLKTYSGSVPVSYGATTNLHVSASLGGIDYIGGYTATVDTYGTVAARPYQLPASPASLTVTRVSDTRHDISWPNPATSIAPVQRYRLMRSTNGGPYYTIAYVYQPAVSRVDTGLASNGRYRWRVRAENSSGVSGFVFSDYWATTPAAPFAVQAGKRLDGAIVITWADASPYNDTWTVAQSTNGGASWTTLGVQPNATREWVHVNPDPLYPHLYSIQAVSVDGATLSSARAISNEVRLLTAPGMPWGLAPNGGVTDATAVTQLAWKHNALDSTAQTAAEFEYRVNGGAWVLGTVATAEMYAIPADTWANGADVIEWHVRTKGQHPDWSPWSATAAYGLNGVPIATITAPEDGGTVPGTVATAEWGSVDAEGDSQATWHVSLCDALGGELEVAEGLGTVSSHVFGYRLEDATSYIVELYVTDTAGSLSETTTATFVVAYEPPPTPTLAGVWVSETAAVSMTITNPSGVPTVEHNELERSLDEGVTWEVLADDVPENGAWLDPHPGLHSTQYRAVAVSDMPSVATSDVLTVAGAPCAAWLTTMSGDVSVGVPLNLVIPHTTTPALELFQFLGRAGDGAQRKRTAVHALDVAPERRVSLAGEVEPGWGMDLDAFELILGRTVLYRDPWRRWYGVVTSLSFDPSYTHVAISATVEETAP